MTKPRELPSVEVLREHFDYNPETGIVSRIKRHARNSKLGPVGTKDAYGYLRCGLNHQTLHLSRIAWKMMTGTEPVVDIDHINRDRTDNRWCNLRAASKLQSVANRVLPSQHLPGVHKKGKSWHSRITIDGKRLHLGVYDTEAEAHLIFVAAHVKIYGEFSPF